jgi:hypothetical protein
MAHTFARFPSAGKPVWHVGLLRYDAPVTRRVLLVLGILDCAAPALALALEPGLPQRVHSVGGALRAPILLGEPAELTRDVGFGFAVGTQWFYRPSLGLSLAAEYDRFGSAIDTDDQLSRFSFRAAQLFAWPFGRLLPWAALGGGAVVGLYRHSGVTVSDTMPMAGASAGLAVEVHRRTTVGVGAGYDLIFMGDSVAIDGNRRVTVFDDVAYATLGVEYYF